jgi:hypothetical protein
MSRYWEDKGITKRQSIVVCAACKHDDLILCSARHWDRAMNKQLKTLKKLGSELKSSQFEQGFIDQFGEFLTREEAFEVVKESGQSFDIKRNGHAHKLFSEGLY